MIVTSGVGGKGVALETSRVMAVPFLWCGVITHLCFITTLYILHIFYKYHFVSVSYLIRTKF